MHAIAQNACGFSHLLLSTNSRRVRTWKESTRERQEHTPVSSFLCWRFQRATRCSSRAWSFAKSGTGRASPLTRDIFVGLPVQLGDGTSQTTAKLTDDTQHPCTPMVQRAFSDHFLRYAPANAPDPTASALHRRSAAWPKGVGTKSRLTTASGGVHPIRYKVFVNLYAHLSPTRCVLITTHIMKTRVSKSI